MDGACCSLLFSAAEGIVCLFDDGLTLAGISSNTEHILGYKAEELAGRSIRDLGLIHPEDLGRTEEHLGRMISGNGVVFGTCRFITRTGDTWTGEVCGVPLRR